MKHFALLVAFAVAVPSFALAGEESHRMHRIDGLDHVANKFDEGDPLAPREATQVTPQWLNAVQEEICNVIEGADIALDDSNETARNQLLAAIDKLNPVKAACTVSCDGAGGVTLIGSARNVSGVAIQAAGGGLPTRVRVTFTNEVPTPIACNVTLSRQPSVGVLPSQLVTPVVQDKSTTYVEFAIRSLNGAGAFDGVTVSTLSQRYDVVLIGV